MDTPHAMGNCSAEKRNENLKRNAVLIHATWSNPESIF
jgi:hypothetical protein